MKILQYILYKCLLYIVIKGRKWQKDSYYRVQSWSLYQWCKWPTVKATTVWWADQYTRNLQTTGQVINEYKSVWNIHYRNSAIALTTDLDKWPGHLFLSVLIIQSREFTRIVCLLFSFSLDLLLKADLWSNRSDEQLLVKTLWRWIKVSRGKERLMWF